MRLPAEVSSLFKHNVLDSIDCGTDQLVLYQQRLFVHTWLILPVVICLSQRLSHAFLRISCFLQICEWLIKTVIVLLAVAPYMDTHGNSIANACLHTQLQGRVALISSRTIPSIARFLVIYGKCADHMAAVSDVLFKFLTYQLPTGRSWLPVAMTGNGELGFDSGEGA